MNKLKWWFRIVGVFYLILTFVNIYALFLSDGQIFGDTLPSPVNADPLAIRAFMDAWMVFVFEFGVLGVMALVASRSPLQHRIMAWVVIWAEVFRGVVADAIWIGRGYSTVSYGVFIVVHLVIVVTGILLVRRAGIA